jgi:hypothetical protein
MYDRSSRRYIILYNLKVLSIDGRKNNYDEKSRGKFAKLQKFNANKKILNYVCLYKNKYARRGA